MTQDSIGFYEEPKNGNSIIRARTTLQLRSWDMPKSLKALEQFNTEIGKAEIPSTAIGDKVMEKLKALDYIAYIRFASVYREFADITALKQAVDSLVTETPHNTAQLPLLTDEMAPGKSRKKRQRKVLAQNF